MGDKSDAFHALYAAAKKAADDAEKFKHEALSSESAAKGSSDAEIQQRAAKSARQAKLKANDAAKRVRKTIVQAATLLEQAGSDSQDLDGHAGPVDARTARLERMRKAAHKPELNKLLDFEKLAKKDARLAAQAAERAKLATQRRETETALETSLPLAAWFLGPKAEHGDLWKELIDYVLQDYFNWRRNYFPNDPVVISRARRRDHAPWIDALNTRLDSILNELKAHFPFYSPRYLAHMLSEQTLPSVLGYLAGMLYNPNNVTDEAAPVTVRLELEVGQMIAEMLGYKRHRSWAHICSGGTVANIEALWVARTCQFMPFVLRDYCRQKKIDFEIKVPDGTAKSLRDCREDRLLLALRPNEAIFMARNLTRYLVHQRGRRLDDVAAELREFVDGNRFNVQRRGFAEVVKTVGLRPRFLVSAAAHYSIRKAANVLGYGEDAVLTVPVTERFRIDAEALKKSLYGLRKEEYVAAVIGIVGTTEEGAIDPIHEIQLIRTELSKMNRSFWLHVDAAWGGYFRSMFCGFEVPRLEPRPDASREETLGRLTQLYAAEIDARETVAIPVTSVIRGRRIEERRRCPIHWDEPAVYSALLAIPDADSVTVDPHKMGYVPYPAGVIAFANGMVTELITQKAQYIFADVGAERKALDKVAIEVREVGPYILEGSKPGAAAAACWLAHKTIPLTLHGHGKVAKTAVLNGRKLARYLQEHKHMFRKLNEESGDTWPCDHPFTFVPLFEPDTNIICYVARRMACINDSLVAIDVTLEEMNRLNRKLHHMLSIPGSSGAFSYSQPYFVSRTTLEAAQYSAESVTVVLQRLGIATDEYIRQGLFVLRSTVMNPLYHLAAEEGKDHLFEFVKYLHHITLASLRELEEAP